MTVSRRYLPASLFCLVTICAGSQAFAASGSALDPYSNVSAPTTLKGSKKDEKGKKAHKVPIIKKADNINEKIVQDDTTSSQTYVKVPGSKGSRHIKQQEMALTPEPRPEHKREKIKSVPTTTKVSDLETSEPLKEIKAARVKEGKEAKVKAFNEVKVKEAKVREIKETKVKEAKVKNEKEPKAKEAKVKDPKESKISATSSSDDSVMGGIKTIGEGYSRTFKAASHGVVSSTKAASEAVMAGGKKMGDGIRSGAKASGEALKKGADIVGHSFKATGEKIKEEAAPIGEKLAKAPAAAAKGVKAAGEKTKEETESLGSKIAHMPKPKMPKISFGGKKKSEVAAAKPAVVEPAAAPEADVASSPRETLIDQPVLKQTPVGDAPQQTAQMPAKVKTKTASNKVRNSEQGLASLPGNVSKKIGRLWPFGHKDTPATSAGDVAGKQTQPPM